MRFAAVSTAAFVLILAACSSGKAPEEDVQAAATPAPAQKTVFDTQLKSLQKAKDVQKTVNKQKADLDQAMQDQGG
jgi:hypothetical protein